MHEIQKKLSCLTYDDINNKSLREIGELIDVNHPFKIKYHLEKLKQKGFKFVKNKKEYEYKVLEANKDKNSQIRKLNIKIAKLIEENELLNEKLSKISFILKK